MRDPATLPKYPVVLLLWQGGSDTAHIAKHLAIPEYIVARCIDKYLDTKWRAPKHYRVNWDGIKREGTDA